MEWPEVEPQVSPFDSPMAGTASTAAFDAPDFAAGIAHTDEAETNLFQLTRDHTSLKSDCTI